ncbi:flagellin [Paenibacillus glycanilyticus]|uniref:flagellin N-terminal helical domain-containing protein n=1 Tax=Paenibacillus glycanilyticus TaxID=126569 RepID=UPI003EBEA1C3
MRINHNIAALNTLSQLNNASSAQSKSMEKLSSGLRINRAGDDAAGLAISEKMRGQIRGLDMAAKNAQDGISLIQTAEGALNETHSILQRMRELAVQSASDTNTEKDRGELQKEMNQLTSEINRIGNTTEFNTKKLLNGDLSSEKITGSVTTKVVNDITTFNPSYAVGVTINGTSNPTFKGAGGDNQIDIANNDGTVFDWNTADNGTLKVEKTADGNIKVSLTGGTDADGDTLDFSDEYATLKDGVYTYDNHGITFSVSAKDVAAMATGDGFDMDLGTRETASAGSNAGAIGLSSDYQSGATFANGASVIDNLAVDGSKLDPRAATLDIGYDGTDLTVTVKDASGNALNTVKTSAIASGSKFDAFGVSFEFNADFDPTDTFDLNQIKLSTTSTTVDTKEDHSATFQIGANQNQSMSLGVSDMRASALGITGTGTGFSAAANVTDGTDNNNVEKALDVTTAAGAANAITVIDNAIEKVSGERSKLGAVQNRLEHTINNLGTSSENLTAAESRIRDVDMAKEMMEQTKNSILAQAAQAMLAQANQQPQGVLQLLR